MKRSNLSSLSVLALVIVALAFVFGFLGAEAQTPVGSGFTYQGRMFDATNAPMQGTCDLSLRLYDQDTGGAQIGATITITGVVMSDGYFDVTPDFGAPSFNGEARWLEIESACPPGAGATTFPRQAVNIVPYALYALNSSAISGTVYYVTSTIYVTETFYYTPTTHNLLSAIHSDTTADNVVRGDLVAGKGVSPTWASLAKGLAYAVLTGDGTDTAWSTFLLSGVAGGKTNFDVTNAKTLTFTSANDFNLTAEQSGAVLVRTATPNIVAGAFGATPGNARGGGAIDLQLNRAVSDEVASGTYSVIFGGFRNKASGYAAGVLSGYYNIASGEDAIVPGGVYNVASGNYSSVMGGSNNTAAGDYSVAMGFRAKTGAYNGTFVFADSTMADFSASTADEFAIRARGGFSHCYDDLNCWTAQISNAGVVTLDATGSGAGFTFSDPITVPSPLTIGTNQLSLPLAWSAIISVPTTYTPTAHTQDWTTITGQPATYTPTAHTQGWTTITGQPATYTPTAHTQDWTTITGQPTTYTPTAHTQGWTTITGQPATYTPTAHTQDWTTITDQPASYTPTLGVHTWTGLQTFNAGASAASGQFIDALTDGSTGGFRAGASSDVLWYRGAADTWRTPDSMIVDGSVGIGTVTAPGTKLEVTVADGVVGSRIKGTTGIVRLYPYYNATYGSMLEAFKPTESEYITFTLSGSPIFFNGKVGIGTVTPNSFTLQVAGNVGPNASNTFDLGSASTYWATIHYHTLTSHSLGVFNTTVTLQDGREVSCLDALKEIKADPSKTIKGIPHMDYATIPSEALNPAPIVGFDYRTMTATKDGEDGADLDMMVSLVLCADKELDAKSAALDSRMSDLEKRIADLEQKVK